jgi:hypothetical protein
MSGSYHDEFSQRLVDELSPSIAEDIRLFSMTFS